jgi:transcriptional regulator GlxA family with amidase domain
MRIDAIQIGRDPPHDVNVIIEVPLGGQPIKYELDALARRVAMSRRTFTRQFQKVTGTSVMQWLMHQRLTLAGRLLETTGRPVESIAADAGFGSALSLRQHFAARYGVTPAVYRRQYRAEA